MSVTINYTISGGGGGGGGGLGTIAGASDYSTATLPTEQTNISYKLSNGIPFSATTAVATAPAPTGTFTPVSSTAPPAGFNVLVCTSNAGNFPAAIDGVTSMALNDSLEYNPALGIWVLNKATVSIADLTDHAAVAQLNSTQQTEVAGGATVALLNSGKTAFKDPAGGSDISFAPLNSSQVTEISGGATTALLNSAKTALKDPAGGSDIQLSGVTHYTNYTASSAVTGVTTESAALTTFALGALPAGAVVDVTVGITGNSDAGTTTLRMKFNGTTIGSFTNNGGQTINSIVAKIVCTGSAAQWLTGEERAGSTVNNGSTTNNTVDTSASTSFTFTLQNSTTTRSSQIIFVDASVRLS